MAAPKALTPPRGTARSAAGATMSAVPQTLILLTPESYRRIDREIAKFPAEHKASAVMAALAIAQKQLGWLSKEVIEEVGNYLDMPAIAVYEVASFYGMYKLEPAGRFKITICTNLPCALSGANRAAAYLKERLGVGFGETTEDGCFTLKEGECLAPAATRRCCSSTTSAWTAP